MVGRCLPAVVVAAGLGLVLSVALASAAGGTDITGTWTCCGAGGAGAQQWVITDSSGSLSGSGLEGTSVFATISGSVSGNSVTIVTTYTQDVGYVATFVGTVSADGTTMSGSWTSNQHQSGTWTATAPGKRSSAVGVNCYTVDPGEPTEYLQCTAAVADASGQQTADTPTGTVAFAINAGGTGGFQGSSACSLLPSQTGGPTSYCSVNYVPPSGGLALGAQPPITATYSGDKTFAPSSGQPLTLQAVEQQDCSAAFNPGCVGVDPVPPGLAAQCVSLAACAAAAQCSSAPRCTPGDANDSDESIDLSDDQDLLVADASCPSSLTLTSCEMNAYLSGDASPDLTAKVQYILNYNSYMDFLTSERNDLVASLHATLAAGAQGGGYSQVTFNAISITWTQDLNKVYDALSTPGTDTSNVGLTLNDAWCNSSADVAGCKANVAAIQASLNSSISQLASQKASLGVNKPFVPPSQTQGSIRRGLPVQVARASKPTHLATIVLAAVKTFTLKPGQTKKVILAIPAAVRAELKQLLGNKRSRTIHGHLVMSLATGASFTTRQINVTIHLLQPKKKHR